MGRDRARVAAERARVEQLRPRAQLEGDRAGARQAYERALAIDPAHRRARGNLDALGEP